MPKRLNCVRWTHHMSEEQTPSQESLSPKGKREHNKYEEEK